MENAMENSTKEAVFSRHLVTFFFLCNFFKVFVFQLLVWWRLIQVLLYFHVKHLSYFLPLKLMIKTSADPFL